MSVRQIRQGGLEDEQGAELGKRVDVVKGRTAVLGLVVLIVGFGVGFGVASSDDGDDSEVRSVQISRLTEMEQSGEMHDVLERHRQMLVQMEDDASPGMLQRMDNDPMWQMMRSEEWAQMDEQHQADIDRMIGKSQP